MTYLEELDEELRTKSDAAEKINWIRRNLPKGVTLIQRDGKHFLWKRTASVEVDIAILETELLAGRSHS